MNSVEIRKALLSDIPAIYGLVHELAVFEQEPEALVCTPEEYEEAFREGLIDALVATTEGQVVGMALFYMTFSTWKGKCLYLEDFYIKPEYRNRGIGQLLFDGYIEEGQLRKARLVKWQVLDWNTEAQRFYVRNHATIEKNWWNGKILFPR